MPCLKSQVRTIPMPAPTQWPPQPRLREEAENSIDPVEAGFRPSRDTSIRLDNTIKRERDPTSPLDLDCAVCEKQLRDCREQKSEHRHHSSVTPFRVPRENCLVGVV